MTRPRPRSGPVEITLLCGGLGALVAAVAFRLGPWAALVAAGTAFLVLWTWRGQLRRTRAALLGLEQQQRANRETLEALALAIDARDPSARGHARRVQVYALELGRLVIAHAPDLLPTPDHAAWLDGLGTAALLHDVGKLGTPERLLSKNDSLSRGEREKLRDHVRVGELIVSRMPLPAAMAAVVRSHHEHWDGSGYPDALAGPAIPFEARLVGLVDAVDALRRGRDDFSRVPLEEICEFLHGEAGRRFDPRLADLFARHAGEIEAALTDEEARDTSTVPAAGSDGPDVLLSGIADAPRESAALYDLACRLGSTLDLEETLALAATRVCELLPAHSCAFYLADPQTGQLSAQHAAGPLAELLERRRFAPAEANTGWCFAAGQPAFNVDPATDLGPEAAHVEPPARSLAVFPIVEGREVLGVLALYAAAPRAFTTDHRRILETVAPQFAQVLRNVLLFAETRASSMTDPLTGLHNNRYLHAQLEKELARATRRGVPLSVVVLDLDEFKPVNDVHGHLAGDAVLRRVAELLREGFRACDTVIRYAGDEFVALLPETSPEEARAIVRRIQERITATAIPVPSGATVSVGVSAGTSCFPIDGSTLEELVRRADRDMYGDKALRKAARGPVRVS